MAIVGGGRAWPKGGVRDDCHWNRVKAGNDEQVDASYPFEESSQRKYFLTLKQQVPRTTVHDPAREATRN